MSTEANATAQARPAGWLDTEAFEGTLVRYNDGTGRGIVRMNGTSMNIEFHLAHTRLSNVKFVPLRGGMKAYFDWDGTTIVSMTVCP
jgi:hypothetical protein